MKNVLVTWAMWLIWLESVNFFLDKWFLLFELIMIWGSIFSEKMQVQRIIN